MGGVYNFACILCTIGHTGNSGLRTCASRVLTPAALRARIFDIRCIDFNRWEYTAAQRFPYGLVHQGESAISTRAGGEAQEEDLLRLPRNKGEFTAAMPCHRNLANVYMTRMPRPTS